MSVLPALILNRMPRGGGTMMRKEVMGHERKIK